VITVSDRSAQGLREDASGPLLVDLLGATEPPVVVPDEREAIAGAVKQAVAEGYGLVVTTGGTGIAPRDVTPEAVQPLLERELPGVLEAIRAEGRTHVPTAALSRGVAGVIGSSFVVTLPGSTGGARDGAKVVAELAQHVLDQLAGHDHEAGRA
jgi:molybdenum cofactor synthesis domain-containing protein